MKHSILYELRQKLINIRNYQKTLLEEKDNELILEQKKLFNKILDLYLHYSFKYLKCINVSQKTIK